MCQGFSHFSGFVYHFIKAKLANSSIRVTEQRSEISYISYKKTLNFELETNTDSIPTN